MDISEITVKGKTAITFNIKVSPNANQTKWLGAFGQDFKISINASPDKGKANNALIKFLSEEISVPFKNISIVSGETKSFKKIMIFNISKNEFIEKYENS